MKKNNAKRQLKSIGLKITPARLAILNFFSDKCQPLSAEIIYEKLNKNDVDLVTVYRTLKSLEKMGVLRKVDLHKDAQFYELDEHHHHHIICKKCGFIEMLKMSNVERLLSKIVSTSNNFKIIKDHSLEFFGVCTMCVKAI